MIFFVNISRCAFVKIKEFEGWKEHLLCSVCSKPIDMTFLQTEGISLNSGRLNHNVVIKNESRNQENRFPGAGCITHLMEKADEGG